MKKWIRMVLVTGAAVVAMCNTAFAGTWKEDQTGWYWQEEDGTYPASVWSWIDGNQDGIAECYYFNNEGYLVTGTTTPDGHQVDADGCWIADGKVQTQGETQGPANAAEAYAAAMKKTNELDSFSAKTLINMKMSLGTESYDIVMDMDMKVKDVNSSQVKYLANINMNMMGENMVSSMFYVDGYYYMDILGSKIKMKMPINELIDSSKSSSSGMMQELEYLQDIQMTEDGAGNKIFSFICKTDSLNSMMGQLLEDQMGVSGVSSMQIRDYKGTVTVNAEGYIVACNMTLNMNATIQEIPVRYDVNLNLDYLNPGQPVDFTLPSTNGYTSLDA